MSRPYSQRLEDKEYQANYHKQDVCGSNFHGLSSTLQSFAQADNLEDGLKQIDRCIYARESEMNVRGADETHVRVVMSLLYLREKYLILSQNHYYYKSKLPFTIITYDDRKGRFNITLDGISIGGRKNNVNKKRKQYKKLIKNKIQTQYNKRKQKKKLTRKKR